MAAVFLCHIEIEAALVGFSDFYVCHSQQVLGVCIAWIEVVGSQQQLCGLLVVAFVVCNPAKVEVTVGMVGVAFDALLVMCHGLLGKSCFFECYCKIVVNVVEVRVQPHGGLEVHYGFCIISYVGLDYSFLIVVLCNGVFD